MGLGLNSGDVSAAKPVTSNVEQKSQALSSEDIKSLKEFFNTYNVEKETQDQLIANLENGKVWDSIKKDEQPVSTYEVPSKEDENTLETVSVFKDGSITVSALESTTVDFSSEEPTIGSDENVNNGIAPAAVSPGTVTSGTGYRNYSYGNWLASI